MRSIKKIPQTIVLICIFSFRVWHDIRNSLFTEDLQHKGSNVMTSDIIQDQNIEKRKVSIFTRKRDKPFELTRSEEFVERHHDIFEILSKQPTSNDYKGMF